VGWFGDYMQTYVTLLTQPLPDLIALNKLSREALGFAASTAADSSRRVLTEVEKFLASISSMQSGSPVEVPQADTLRHVSISFLIIASEHTAMEVKNTCCGAACTTIRTLVPDIDLVIISDHLLGWRHSIILGCSGDGSREARECFNNIHNIVSNRIISTLWQGYQKPGQSDKTFRLEKKK